MAQIIFSLSDFLSPQPLEADSLHTTLSTVLSEVSSCDKTRFSSAVLPSIAQVAIVVLNVVIWGYINRTELNPFFIHCYLLPCVSRLHFVGVLMYVFTVTTERGPIFPKPKNVRKVSKSFSHRVMSGPKACIFSSAMKTQTELSWSVVFSDIFNSIFISESIPDADRGITAALKVSKWACNASHTTWFTTPWLPGAAPCDVTCT